METIERAIALVGVNAAQTILLNTYPARELLGELERRPSDGALTAADCGDGLFAFLFGELSDGEGCNTIAEAAKRVAAAIADLQVIEQALIPVGVPVIAHQMRGHVESMTVLSTAHLSATTRAKLLDGNLSINAYGDAVGGFVHVGEWEDPIPDEPDLAPIILMARRASLVWLRFDRDAISIPGLKTYEDTEGETALSACNERLGACQNYSEKDEQ